MGNEVYANGMELACKAGQGKSICAFPDVCFTPPQTPATPPGVPIPYPNTGMTSDTSDGSKTVQIGGQEVMLKDKSAFKQSTGDEAGSAPKKGVITSKNRGKVFFNAWSMDVKFEGENVVRNLDLTTHNHASQTGQTPPWPFQDSMARGGADPCEKDKDKEADACKNSTPPDNCSADCYKAQKCKLVPKKDDSQLCCSPASTGHHLIEDHWVQGNSQFPSAQGSSGYGNAPTVCVQGGRAESEHGLMHAVQGVHEDSYLPPSGVNRNKPWNYRAGKRAAVRAHQITFMGSDCDPNCIAAQLDNFYGKNGDRPLLQSNRRQGVDQAQISREEAEVLVETYFGGM